MFIIKKIISSDTVEKHPCRILCQLLKKSIYIIFLTYKKLYMFNVHNLMSFQISIPPLNHHHTLCHQHIHHLQKFPTTFFSYSFFFFLVITTFKQRSTVNNILIQLFKAVIAKYWR